VVDDLTLGRMVCANAFSGSGVPASIEDTVARVNEPAPNQPTPSPPSAIFAAVQGIQPDVSTPGLQQKERHSTRVSRPSLRWAGCHFPRRISHLPFWGGWCCLVGHRPCKTTSDRAAWPATGKTGEGFRGDNKSPPLAVRAAPCRRAQLQKSCGIKHAAFADKRTPSFRRLHND